jgi:hypothetical protein
MAGYNVHERLLPKGVGALIDQLASSRDQIWPEQEWPPLRLDRPLAVGATGGHGPIRYTVEAYQRGEWVRFRFTGPRGFTGFHEFTCHDLPEGTVLRNTLVIRPHGPARLSWPLAFRWLHDALLEDLLDRAELVTTGTIARPARWSPYVRTLRYVLRSRASSQRAETDQRLRPEEVQG